MRQPALADSSGARAPVRPDTFHQRPSQGYSLESANDGSVTGRRDEDIGNAERRTLASLWHALLDGNLAVREIHSGGEHPIALLMERPPGPSPVSSGQIQLLERMLEGSSLKAIGAEFGMSMSTTWQKLSQTARALGLSGRMTSIPLLFSQLFYASKLASPITVPTYRLTGGHLVLLLPPVEVELSRHLPAAEVAVCALMLEGYSHAEIAERRRTSARTIANQLASAFRRLGVSGRVELLAAVARLQLCARLKEATLEYPQTAL